MSNAPTLADQTSRSRILKRVQIDFRDLKADKAQLAVVIDDLRRNGGLYTPAVNWLIFDGPLRRPDEVDDGRAHLDDGFSDEAVAKWMSSMEQMQLAWVGRQRLPVSAKFVERYADYVLAHDPLDLWGVNVWDADVLARYSIADLGSIIDLNIIYSYAARDAGRTTVLEIGGGYGRLAEVAFNVLGGDLKYVLVDSVPGSLLYARDYLRRACPGVRIGYYYDGDPFDLERFDCYIVPSWHFEAVNNATYDICVNIESFQEMGQEQVNAYLRWFQDVSREGALIYISNCHDFRFQGEWNYPATWQRLMCTRIPRAWTPDHRTEVFIKGDQDYSAANAAIVSAYQWGLTYGNQSFPLTGAGEVVNQVLRSPVASAKELLRRAGNRSRARGQRRELHSVFERAAAGDARAQQEYKSYWTRRATQTSTTSTRNA